MRVTVLKEIPDDAELSRNWRRLVDRMEHPEIFFTYQWALAASRAFQVTMSPLLFLMHEGDELCGVAALAVDVENRASFLTATTADYCDIVSAPETRAAVLAVLMQEIGKLKLRQLTLANLPSDSATWKELPAVARAQRLYMASRPAYDCGLVEFGSEDQRRTMVHDVAHKNREQRGLKKLSRIGPVRISHLVHADEAGACLRQVVSAQVARFLATGRISPLVRPERRLFLQELTALLSAEGWLKISQLEVNAQPVAWNYGFRFEDSWFWYLPSFKVEYEDCSPGSCLLRFLVEEGCADPSLRRLDLGLGDESYKNRFATSVRQTLYVELSQSLPRHARIMLQQFVTTGAKHFPSLAVRLRRAREVARSLVCRLRDKGVGATIAHAGRKLVRLIASRDEILLFEAPATEVRETSAMRLNPVTWQALAEAAIEDDGDPDTLQYLLRSAARLKHGGTSGFLLHDELRGAVHFLAVANCDAFHIAEVDYTLNFGESAGGMIFDCWTPARFRRLGYYPLAIRLAASELQKNGKKAWIFCAATNTPSIQGILKAGFTYRFSLVRRRKLGFLTTIGQESGARALQSKHDFGGTARAG